MDNSEKSALILCLIDSLAEKDVWSSETRIQRLVYFLQNLLEVPMDYNFILYKYSPYSFYLRDKLTSLRANMLLTLEADRYSGPRFVTTDLGKQYKEIFHKSTKPYMKRIDSAIDTLGNESILELEQLATALFFTRLAENQEKSILLENRAKEMKKWKPIISMDYAQEVVEKLDTIRNNMLPDTKNLSLLHA